MTWYLYTENLRDMMDYLLMTQNEAEDENKEMKGVLTDKHLVYTIFDIFGGLIYYSHSSNCHQRPYSTVE